MLGMNGKAAPGGASKGGIGAMFGGMGDLAAALPEIMKLAPQAQEFMGHWFEFMKRIDVRTETIDNKLTTVIAMLSEDRMTASVHDEVLIHSRNDPRNAPSTETLRTTPIGAPDNANEPPAPG